jgi:uncharacterized membrane protein
MNDVLGRILYLGDDTLQLAAGYLGAAMFELGYEFVHLPSSEPLQYSQLQNCDLLILSDYPAKQLTKYLEEQIVRRVLQGMSLWMIGGWDSFRGLGGGYNETVISKILPLKPLEKDDRVNTAYPWAMTKTEEGLGVINLPSMDPSPCVAGLNRTLLSSDAIEVLKAHQIKLNPSNNSLSISETLPLMACRMEGLGKVLCLATDLAPHWAGGFVDWGNKSVCISAPNGQQVEVGNSYIDFIGCCLNYLLYR